MTRYMTVFEHDADGWSVCVPDLPGEVAAA